MSQERELLHFVTGEERFRILQTILDHTHNLPTFFEICQFCPGLSQSSVDTRIEELVETDIVRRVAIPEDERTDGYPHEFYGVSEEGWRFLVNHGLLDAVERDSQWDTVELRDPTLLAKHEGAPRPEVEDIFQGDTTGKTPEERLEEYKIIVEQASDALYLLDTDGEYELVNEAYERLTGYERSELLGSSTEKVLDPEAVAERNELITNLLNDETERRSHTWQSTLHSAEGEELPVEVTFSALEYGDQLVGIVGSARDITNRKRRQQELSLLSRVLRHNLSNKVNIIEGYAEVIEQHVDDDRSADYTQRIRHTSEKLINQSEKARDIHELLDSWPPSRQTRDVTAIVDEAVGDVKADFPDAEFTVELPDEAWVDIPDMFERAAEELLHNAVEHSESGRPEIFAGIEVKEEAGSGTVSLFVDDDGPGIPDHEVEVLARSEETQLSHSQGIGLWMVKWIIASADGQVDFASSELGGTRVRVRLPQANPPALTLRM